MILMRISDLDGKYCKIEGGSKIEQTYQYSKAGWFPIDSVSFGFQAQSSKGDGKENGKNNNNNKDKVASVSSWASGGGSSSQEEPYTVSISKSIDAASTLMCYYAMSDRKNAKKREDDEVSLRTADIHFLSSVHVQKQNTMKDSGINMFPYLQIVLDNVLIKGWNISGQGDERPTESFEMWFDKSAMCYHWTEDGRRWEDAPSKGWNQHDNKEWTPCGGKFKYFMPPPKS